MWKVFWKYILYTAGEEDYQNMIDMWISFGDGFLLVFALNDPESFEALKTKHERVMKGSHNETTPLILVGNKSDLENERKVDFQDAKKLADSWKCEYIETSAKTNHNCKEAFEKLSTIILNKKLANDSNKKSCNCNIL